MQDMVCDALRQPQKFVAPNSNNMEEPPNEDTQRFYNLLVEANEPLYEGATDSKLSIFLRLLACKYNWNVLDQCLEFISKIILDATPIKDGLPKIFFDVKRLVSKLGLEAKRIDYCVDGCMLYYDNDVALTECKFCNKPRYCAKTIGTSNRKPVLVTNEPTNVRNQHLKDLSYGPMSYVKEWHTYFVNGYKFHTQAWSEGKK
ncbi:hypothetical protein GmHk_04G010384 [Glycine max]|nr:hypothetical protein GmHk_04G010384 [Glycine max]